MNEVNRMNNKKKLSLPVQILIALVLGIAVGLVCYFMDAGEFTTNYLKPFGDIFVNLLKFIVVPVVLLSMIDGIISMGDMKKVGAVGWKTVAYFLCTTAVACVIGLVFANIFNNAGLFPTLSLEEGAVWDKATSANFMETLVGIFPSNMWSAFSVEYAAGDRNRAVLRRRHHGGWREGQTLQRYRVLFLCGD